MGDVPSPDSVCPVCPHPVKYHDGIGCTSDQAGSNGLQSCPCPVAQDMPDKPLTAGVHAPQTSRSK